MGSSLSGEIEEPEQKEGIQAAADCAQSSCPTGDGKTFPSDVVPVAVDSELKAEPGVETSEEIPAEPEEEAAPDSQAERRDEFQSAPHQRELSPESEADLDVPQVPGQLSEQVKAPRTLEQQMSLKPSDDERTEISKKISWILRHGAKKVNVNMDETGWVNVNDLLSSDILGGTTEDKLLAMINESNTHKPRYELEEDSKGKRIRAISKSRRNAYARELREKERRERDQKKREEDTREREQHREREHPPERDWVPEPRRREEIRGWWDKEDGWQDGPSYEQQIREGFLPVWQGSRLVAMAKENVTVRPGRRVQYGGKGFDHGKGHGHGHGHDHLKDGYEKGEKGHDYRGERGERKGRGKDDSKGKDGKGKFDDKGHGKGDFKDFRHDREDDHTEAKGDRYRGSRQQRWRAVNDRDIIVRVGLGMETDIVGTLVAGSLVAQVGEDKMLKNGIARMFIESIEPHAGIKGWVTRSAEAAGGPVFFKADRNSVREREPRGKEGKSGKGSQFGGEKGRGEKGKGRRLDADANAGQSEPDGPPPVAESS